MRQDNQNPIQRAMVLSEQVKAARENADRLHAEVKRMHNEVYAPLCAAKAEAQAEYERLAGELKALIKANSELFTAIKKLG